MRDDDVNGTIVGGNFKSGAIYYDGRMQGQVVHEESESKLVKRLKDNMQKKIADCENVFKYVYPKSDAWEIRIYN